MFWTLVKRAALTVAVVTAATVLTVPGTAHADTVDWPHPIDSAHGAINVHGDTTSWDLTITRRLNWVECAYLQITVNRNNRFDPDYQSSRVCNDGDSTRWQGSATHSHTKDARFYLCFDLKAIPDWCNYKQHIPKR